MNIITVVFAIRVKPSKNGKKIENSKNANIPVSAAEFRKWNSATEAL